MPSVPRFKTLNSFQILIFPQSPKTLQDILLSVDYLLTYHDNQVTDDNHKNQISQLSVYDIRATKTTWQYVTNHYLLFLLRF